MTDKQDIVAIAMAVCIAAYIALAVDYVAHHDLGVSNALIRGAAIGEIHVERARRAAELRGVAVGEDPGARQRVEPRAPVDVGGSGCFGHARGTYRVHSRSAAESVCAW